MSPFIPLQAHCALFVPASEAQPPASRGTNRSTEFSWFIEPEYRARSLP